ncbi:MAG: hypothetical protein H6686_10420 [Fibrobacteria bacterium]|nr:hypothetical protein [Fibrobacteria bacterium]
MIHNRTARLLLPALALGATFQAGASVPAAIGETAISEKIDSIDQYSDKLDGLVRRSLLNGGSKPVSFAGEADAKLVASSFYVAPQWMLADKTEFKNSQVTIRLAMVAKPHRNLTLWSKIAFNNALLGYPKRLAVDPTMDSTMAPGDAAWTVAASSGDANDKRPAVLYEDMAVGAILSAGPASFNFKAGGVLWNEMSPLTVWKTQPRMFGWDYLPFELEQPTAMFYDYATVKGFKEGRAAWNKKPFQGLQLESIELPYNFYLNTVYGFYEGYNKNSPWLVPNDKTNELQYTGETVGGNPIPKRTAASKGIGIGDNYRAIWLLRGAKAELPFAITAGLNWFQYLVDKDYPKQWSEQWSALNGYTLEKNDGAPIRAMRPWSGGWVDSAHLKIVWDSALTKNTGRFFNNFYIEPKVASFDFKRVIPGALNFHVDVGASSADTVWFKVSRTASKHFTSEELAKASHVDSVTILNEFEKYDPRFRDGVLTANPYEEIGRTTTGWKPALFASVSYPFQTPIGDIDVELRSIYADKEFHSGASTVGPINGIFPYEANMTGPGKFAGVDNGTAYASNLAGTNLIVKLPVPRGHARVSLGFHQQLEEGDDLVYLPWRQNGAAFQAALHSDFTRYGVGLLDDYWRSTAGAATTPADKRMIRRLGDESFFRSSVRNPYAPITGFAGGMRADYMAIYENFAAYQLTRSWNMSSSRRGVISALSSKPTRADSLAAWVQDSTSRVSGYIADSTSWMAENGDVYNAIIANQDSSYFRMQHKKATQNLSVDASYEISRQWNGKRSVFISGYAAFNSVTNGPGMGIPAFGPGKDVLLVGRNLRFEPVFQVTPKFYVIALASQETWQSDYGVAAIDSATGLAPGDDGDWFMSTDAGRSNLRRAPIDYTDWIYGLGFDWDIAPRVSFHVRGQYFTHEDAGISVDLPTAAGRNDYRAWEGSAEMKMWF